MQHFLMLRFASTKYIFQKHVRGIILEKALQQKHISTTIQKKKWSINYEIFFHDTKTLH